jgi:hypothetical protein
MVKRGSKRIISLPEFFGFAVLNEHQLNFLQGPQAEPKRTLKSGRTFNLDFSSFISSCLFGLKFKTNKVAFRTI